MKKFFIYFVLFIVCVVGIIVTGYGMVSSGLKGDTALAVVRSFSCACYIFAVVMLLKVIILTRKK